VSDRAGGHDIGFYVVATALNIRISLLHSTAFSTTQPHRTGCIFRIAGGGDIGLYVVATATQELEYRCGIRILEEPCYVTSTDRRQEL